MGNKNGQGEDKCDLPSVPLLPNHLKVLIETRLLLSSLPTFLTSIFPPFLFVLN